MMSGIAPRHPVVIVEPAEGWFDLELPELWRARGLLYFLTWRDVKVRYKQTVLGVVWAVLQPVLTVAVFTVLFGRFVGVDSGGAPYAVFAFSGLLPWTFFAQGVARSSNSLVSASNLIRKVYFPRLAVPLAAIFAGLVDLALSGLALAVLMIVYRTPPGWQLVGLPAVVLLTVLATSGLGVWLAALNAQYRDVGLVVPFLVQIWLFVTPVIYRSQLVTDRLAALRLPRCLFALNPMVGVVEGFRWALLGWPPGSGTLLVSGLVSAVLLVSGVVYFRHVESTLADVV